MSVNKLAEIKRILAGHEPEILAPYQGAHAAVALILHDGPAGLQALFIERAAHDRDPWSGNVGLPGGKVEESDGDARRAAERETLEEVGIDLREARYLGRLSDIAGAHLPIRVSCFVYGISLVGRLHLNDEVRDAFWVPIDALSDSRCRGDAPVRFAGQTLIRPSIRLPQPGKPVVWGLTYRLVLEFLELLGRGEGDDSL